MKHRETVQDVLQGLVSLEETLADPMLATDDRAFGEETVMRAHDFLIARQGELRVERERLLEVEDVASLAMADYITLLLGFYASAGSAAAGAIEQARGPT